MIPTESINQTPYDYLNDIGVIFTVFDERTQDSGNVSYGVEIGSERYFVKTAGHPDRPGLPDYPGRLSLLRNAVYLSQNFIHPALPTLYRVMESSNGPMLFYEWATGELVRGSVLQRFKALSTSEVLSILDVIYEVHHQLAQSGWIASDFYDGCIIYDFENRIVKLVDLDNYRQSPFLNDMGRMFGSARFMAPEEFELGQRIDEQTTVFTMGRTAAVLLSDNSLERNPFRGSTAQYEVMLRACQHERERRFLSMSEFFAAWMEARNAE